MQLYIVTTFWVNLSTGIVELTEKQYSSRQHNLKKLGGNKYDILKPVQFKRGEVFGYEGEMGKSLGKDMAACDKNGVIIEAEVKKEKKKDDAKG